MRVIVPKYFIVWLMRMKEILIIVDNKPIELVLQPLNKT